MDLIQINPQANATNDAKFRLVFSQRKAIRLNRFILPINCSTRARRAYNFFGIFLCGVLAFDRYGITGTMPRLRAMSRLALAS